jgi:hypothetical protein
MCANPAERGPLALAVDDAQRTGDQAGRPTAPDPNTKITRQAISTRDLRPWIRANTDTRLILAVLAGLEIDDLSAPLRSAQVNMIRSVLRRLFLALECVQNRPAAYLGTDRGSAPRRA